MFDFKIIRGADHKTSALFIFTLILLSLCHFAQAQSPPALITPRDGASFPLGDILRGFVVLDWSDVEDATGYAIDIDGPLGFWNLFPESTESEMLFSTSLTGEYKWKTRAFVNEDFTAYSTPRSLLVTGDIRPSPSPTPTSTPSPLEKNDLNRDGRINYHDLFTLSLEWSEKSSIGDINGDQKIDAEDYLLFLRQWHR